MNTICNLLEKYPGITTFALLLLPIGLAFVGFTLFETYTGHDVFQERERLEARERKNLILRKERLEVEQLEMMNEVIEKWGGVQRQFKQELEKEDARNDH